MNRDAAGDIFEKIKRHTSADEVEALFYGGRSALTRFANNTIHQNVAEEHYGVSVRTVFGGRTARATTNKFDDDSLRRVVQASETLAKVQEPDADLLPMAAGELSDATPSRYFQQTADIAPEQRAAAVKKIVEDSREAAADGGRYFFDVRIGEGIFNSRGLNDWHAQTSSEISVTMLAADSSGWQKANSPNVSNLDAVMLAETAAKKAQDSAYPKKIVPGKYTVILEPAAVFDLVGFMFFDFGGLAILDQRSFLNNRLGTKVFGDNINIWDDVEHPLQSGAPFDGEGVRRQRVELVENGVVKRLVYARATAEKMKRSEYKEKVGLIAATGHGFPLPNEMGEAPMNIVFGTTVGAENCRPDDRVHRPRHSGHSTVVHPRGRSLTKKFLPA